MCIIIQVEIAKLNIKTKKTNKISQINESNNGGI